MYSVHIKHPSNDILFQNATNYIGYQISICEQWRMRGRKLVAIWCASSSVWQYMNISLELFCKLLLRSLWKVVIKIAYRYNLSNRECYTVAKDLWQPIFVLLYLHSQPRSRPGCVEMVFWDKSWRNGLYLNFVWSLFYIINFPFTRQFLHYNHKF